MISMTGFGFGEGTFGSLNFTVELKSYNNRYLDLFVNLPPILAPWEPVLRDWLAEAIPRGRVEFNVRIKENAEGKRLNPDLGAARDYALALAQVRKAAGLSGSVRLEHLLQFPEIFQTEKEKDREGLWKALDPIRHKVLADFQDTRKKEGARLMADILGQLEVIQAGRAEIEGRSAQMETTFRENLKKKFDELSAEADENRILSETALLLVRYGINEELVRLASHIQAFSSLGTQTGPVGKKLDFLCQELGREINTIGSKTTFADVQQRVVGMKDALENMREQLRNVE